MGMHFGLIAVRGTVADLKIAFTELWPKLEVEREAADFTDTTAIWAWKSANEQFVSSAQWTKDDPGTDVYIFCQDGPWATMTDSGYALAGDEAALKALSLRFGTALSFIVENVSGCAYFECYKSGQLHRCIRNDDTIMTASGTPLPEENGINVDSYYVDETEQLMQAFGISPPHVLPSAPSAVAISVIDRNDYSQPLSHSAMDATDAGPTKQVARPWWRFW